MCYLGRVMRKRVFGHMRTAKFRVGVWGEGTHYISTGWDVLTDGVFFSETVWNRDVFHCKTSGKVFKYTCLERGR